ncbi:NAD-dependent protein deacylase [Enterococcus sp. BWT-B8]|uniref:NAD-dependent protein deacylase n=1 Tax=Enterococcus sp. BWT-B8 TaxID=2885157 RepID=UPI001E463568|nr:NAD-dependent protein deacylase [Enterococcus sp. BWT-B8]MCB5952911.1 NAD-dependent protein deacylase [Enterococcus sp. BWT-B8]
MEKRSITDGKNWIEAAQSITFLTGAGVSTASGIPDYRSLKGVYQGLERPEYLLSRTCLLKEPEKFYHFVKKLYHPKAKPNVIHQVIADLEKSKNCWTVSQNIDGLHQRAGSENRIDFHGSLYCCSCEKCCQEVDVAAYLNSDRHDHCGGQLRPDIVLYEEGFEEQIIEHAVEAVAQAELIVIVGTTFQVHPFCDLIFYAQPTAKIMVVNQQPVPIQKQAYYIETDAVELFKQITAKE